MIYEMLCQNSITGIVYDITTLCSGISYQTTLGGQPGKLTFSVLEDPGNVLEMVCGSIISFIVDGTGVFFGYIFEMDTDESGSYKITAYDQMYYLKNEEIYITSNETASDIFIRVCRDVFPSTTHEGQVINVLNYEVVTLSSFIVPAYNHEDKTLYEIIEHGINQTNVYENMQNYYFIKDKFGTLQFTSLTNELTNLVIGDGSLLTGYHYKISIDKNTYNTIKIYRVNEKKGKWESWIQQDPSTQRQWGKLQMVEKVDSDLNEAEIRELANNYFKLYNRESKTMKLTALGYKEIVAGSGFLFSLEKLNINQYMWVTSATHNFEESYHTMTLDVFI